MDKSPFKKLSAEIRNAIWDLVVTEPHCLDLDRHNVGQPSITKVCKEVRNETLLMFYRTNTFLADLENADCYDVYDVAEETNGIASFLKMRPQYHAAVQTLMIRINFFCNFGGALGSRFFKHNADKWAEVAEDLNEAGYKAQKLDLIIFLHDDIEGDRAAALQNLKGAKEAFKSIGLESKVKGTGENCKLVV